LAVPLKDFKGKLVAIINFTAPAVRMSEDKVIALYPELQQVAARIADEVLM
jgi:DNA-binding IclR family transcriptional regulator